MERWVETRKAADFNKMAEEHGISPITARVLRNRDLIDREEIRAFLSPLESTLNNPMMHSGMDRVICVLKGKIGENKKIRIIGDYDVDGISATFILYKGLKFFGADVDYVIPHRIEDGYGINKKLILDASRDGIDTIVTCDNGISAFEQTEYAHELGLTMVITDHHEVPFEEADGERRYILPNADALVDPKTPDSEYPFKGICGAYVSFQTICAYALSLGVSESKDFVLLRDELLEFASLATICDVMELRGENRALVSKGMRLLSKSKNLGMRMLLHVTELEGKTLNPFHCGFVIGPCLNASGRLDTSLKALDLFLETDENLALVKAQSLKDLNEERKSMTISETEKAFSIVESMDVPDKVLVIYLPDCHESLAGIIAGRVREKYTHPAFVVTKTENGLKGSGRSIDAFDMFEALNIPCVKEHLTKFGGHKLAAGISLSDEEELEKFKEAINATSTLKEEDFSEVVRIDMELPFYYADLNLAHDLEKLEPYGTGNEKPMFALGSVTFINGTKIGKNKNVGKYKVKDNYGRISELIYFGDLNALEDYVESIYGKEIRDKFHNGEYMEVVLGICYQLDVNEFMGKESAKLIMKYYR